MEYTPQMKKKSVLTIPMVNAIPMIAEPSINKNLDFSLAASLEQEFPKPAKDEKFVILVNALRRLTRYAKIFKIKRKRMKHRKYVIDELIETEKQFVYSLEIIKDKIMINAKEKSLLNKSETEEIFCNLESIYGFNKEFHNLMKKSVENFTNQSLFALNLTKMLDFFKLYFPYCDNFQAASSSLERMKLKQHPFTEWIKGLEFTPDLQNLDLSSLLIKPVQRLPKYVLLFKDLMKNTPNTHPDYVNIQKCLNKFQEINTQNNYKMSAYLKKIKVVELDEKFGKANNIEIVDPKREFLEEEALHIVLDNEPRAVICYFFSDLILVTENVNKVSLLVNYLYLDHNSYVRDLPNHKYFKWIFSVYGKGLGLTFSTENKETKKSLKSFIETKIINVLREKANMKLNAKKHFQPNSQASLCLEKLPSTTIQVCVLGTMKRGIQHFRAYTVYVIEIRYELKGEEIMTRLFFRYSELTKLDELIKTDFPTININHLPPKHWFSAHKTKTIESRKLLIENFFQSILTNEDLVRKNSFKILEFIGLPESFIEIFTTAEEKASNSVMFKSVLDFDESNKIEEKMGRISVYTTLAASHKTHKKINRFSMKNNSNENSYKLLVKLMNDKTININVNTHTKALEACIEIANQIQLISSLDFKLFISGKNDQNRVLDDDEYLLKALDLVEDEKEQKPKGFFYNLKKGFGNSLKKIINGDSEFVLIYKKYLYLPNDVEENDLKKDPVKLDLVANQIFKEIYTFKYILNLEDYSLITSLQSFIKYGRYQDNEDDLFLMEKIKKFLPPSIFSRRDEKFWLDNISKYWKNISLEIDKITEITAHKKFDEKKNREEETGDFCDDKLVAKLVAVNSMKKHRLYGSELFWVDFHKKSDTPPFAMPDNLWLALKFDSISLLSPEKKESLLELSYDKISKFQSYPTSIVIAYFENETTSKTYRFNTTMHSFEIFQLIDEYEKLHKVIPKMRKANFVSILRKKSFDN